MNTLHLRNIIRVSRLTILLPVSIMLILSAYLSGIDAQDELDDTLNHADSSDMLAYISDENQLMLYDPHERTETLLLENVDGFLLSQDGQVAFTRQNGNNLDLYVFNPSEPDVAPISIHQTPGNEYALAWSSDGRSLAFVSYEDREDQSIFVWNHETITNVMPNNPLDTVDTIVADWSPDGRLAFMVRHGWSEQDIPSEIYLWDGVTTTSLSQNPAGWDGDMSWSRTGKLLFGSDQGAQRGIYIWDGISYTGGLPDTSSFILVGPEFEPRYVRWLNNNHISFTTYMDSKFLGNKEIIIWDPQTETVIERYPVVSDNAWSWLAEGGQVILSSHLASGTPSYYLDVENTDGEIVFSEHVGEFSWSSDGYLAYCRREADYRDWILSIWNGEEAWDIAKVSYRPIRWQNGQGGFSCNNG